MAAKPFALVRTHEQWLNSAHDHTALEDETVSLSWEEVVQPEEILEPKGLAIGLAFDRHCRLYHSVPEQGHLESILWAAHKTPGDNVSQKEPVNLLAINKDVQLGEFAPTVNSTASIQPGSLAVDEDGRLFVAERSSRSVLVYDLWSKRLLRRISLAGIPSDLASQGRDVFVVTVSPPSLFRFDARRNPKPITLHPDITEPGRLTIAPTGTLFVLDHPGTRSARIWRWHSEKTENNQTMEAAERTTWTQFLTAEFARDQEYASDLEVAATSNTERASELVVARRPGEAFLRYEGLERTAVKLPGLKGKHYDGRGIVVTPDNRIAFWTDRGLRYAVAARVRYAEEGRITTYRLDSGEFGTVWGRVFIDACVPEGTSIGIISMALDEPSEGPTLPRTSPANMAGGSLAGSDTELAYPPMPPTNVAGTVTDTFRLHQRETGRELPWVRMADDDPFETYEAPIQAQPGRYLWIRIVLGGNSRSTPRLRMLRAEYPSHDYLGRIPKLFSRDEAVASFLRRYLAPFEGMLGDLDGKAERRQALIDPRSTPPELLPWLAGFVGLVLDERWAGAPRRNGGKADVRRILLEEAIWLFRFRGTVAGLKRLLDIYTDANVVIIEQFRMRGLGWGALGLTPTETSRSVLGGGFRVGGAIGDTETITLTGTVDDAFATHAHRFTVMIPAALTQEEMEVVRHILEVHRPAHTLVQVCTIGAGMRVGRGLHVGLTSLVGRSGGFVPLQVGGTPLGRGTVVGRAVTGTVPGAGHVGIDTRVG